jgi:hypothetical protein
MRLPHCGAFSAFENANHNLGKEKYFVYFLSGKSKICCLKLFLKTQTYKTNFTEQKTFAVWSCDLGFENAPHCGRRMLKRHV